MCQLNVVLERAGGSRETVMESVTGLEVTDKGIVLTTFFEEPVTVSGAHLQQIDFLGGSVLLREDEQN